jgi:predicted MPP superfamily phosphohydrolase
MVRTFERIWKMNRALWLTDVHLNFLSKNQVEWLFSSVNEAQPDAVLLGGDIAESQDVVEYLGWMDRAVEAPVYFVLGNHDYYHGSIAQVRAEVARFAAASRHLTFLSVSPPLELTPGHGLVGHDGWADARYGDYERSLVSMNDYKLIREFVGLSKQDRWPLLKDLGDAAADHIRRVLPEALDRWPHVFLLTHVPPLREACWHEGRISDDQWLPHFTCKAMGDAILEIMRGRPDRRLTVLCGHTHGSGETRPLANVEIFTGGAAYGDPRIQRVFELD